MSTLRVYTAWSMTVEGNIVRRNECPGTDCDKRPLQPGDLVEHFELGGQGLVVGVTADDLTVLWSIEPRPWMSSVVAPVILNVVMGDTVLDKRCSTGPWVFRLFWRAHRCMFGKIRGLLGSASS